MKATEKQKQKMKEWAQIPEVKLRRRSYMKKYHKKYEKENSKEISEKKKKYYVKNKEKINNRNKKWMKNNEEHWKKYRKKYYEKNKEKIIAYGYKWEKDMKENDINFKVKKSLRYRFNGAFKNYVKNGKTNTSDGYGIDYNKIIEHLKPFPKDRHLYHIDHIKPLCAFDLTNPKEVRKAMSPENHQWLLAKDNLHKVGQDKKQSLKLSRKKNNL